MALVAVHENLKDRRPGNCRDWSNLSKAHNDIEGEFGILISDKFQGQGLGREIMERLIDISKSEKLIRINGYILPENEGMLNLAKTLGFELTEQEDNVIEAELYIS